MHSLMLKARVLEERLIQMYRQGDGYFWIGGPGEEAFNVPLGLLIHKGQGPQYDYCHFHYRNSATLLAMGADPVDAMRQMKNTATDPYSGGRNFVGHYSIREWNVVPVSSPIELQYSMAPGTAIANKRAAARASGRGGRKPFLLGAVLSRLYGHSSASGANRVNDEADCITGFERRLEERGLLKRQQIDELRAKFTAELLAAHKRVKEEPQPDPKSIYEHVFA